MKIVPTMALGLALALGAAGAPAVAKEKPAEAKYSPKLIPTLQAIQKAQTDKDWATVKAKADEALPQAVTPDDKMVVGNAYVTVGQNANDNASLLKGIDLMLDSGKAPADLAPKLYAVKGQLAYQNKDYAGAEAALTQAQKAGNTNTELTPILVESMRLQGKNLAALQALNDAVSKQMAAGQPVSTAWFQRGYAIAYNVKPSQPDYAAVRQAGTELNKKWLASAPTKAAWHDAVLLVMDGKSQDADFMADVRRLLLATEGLVGANDYLEYAEAVYLKNPAEAKAVIDTGAKRGVYTVAGNRNLSEINGIASGRLAADKASLAGSEKTAQSNPKVAVAVGDAYYGYANYPKAVAMYQLAGSKGTDADMVNLRVGEALAMSGDAAGAKAAFAQVKAGPRKDLADFWVVHLDHPTQG